MQNQNLKKIVISALFAALTCAATLVIRIPTPGAAGYIHPGDALVILCGVVSGPAYGLLAAGIGSALADLLGGYVVYVPVTFLVKGLTAALAGILYQKVGRTKRARYAAVCLGGLSDIILVTGGYFLFELGLYGTGAALADIPLNLLQGAGGMLLSVLLYPILSAIPEVQQLTAENRQSQVDKK